MPFIGIEPIMGIEKGREIEFYDKNELVANVLLYRRYVFIGRTILPYMIFFRYGKERDETDNKF